MILQSLKELAEREQLIADPAFESKGVRWIIRLAASGRFVEAFDTSTPEALPEGSKKKPRMQAKLMVIPRRQIRPGITPKADFLVDKATYALGLSADPKAPDPRAPQCLAAFIELLASAPDDVPELAATLTFLRNDAERARCAARLAELGGFASNDLFSFSVDDDQEIELIELKELCAWWGDRQTAASDAASAAQCLVCGQHRAPARLHNSLQVRGASTSGVPLVSFNTGAFEKYGLSGNENAPVCQLCMTGYTEALRRLTRPQYQSANGTMLAPQSVVLTGDTTAVYWSDAGPEVSDYIRQLSQPGAVNRLLLSPHTDRQTVLHPEARFYCMILTGNVGRISIRRVHTGTVGEVVANLRRYFRTTNVARFDTSVPLTITQLLRSLVLKGELDKLAADLGTDLWMHALFRTRLPRTFLSAVVARNRAERHVTAERAALLHLYLAIEPKEEDNHAMSLERDNPNQAYLLGRLLATLESLQTAAQGTQLNRTLVDRTFGAASTRPGVVFPQLIQTAQHHMSKAEKKLKGRAINLDKLLGEITDGLNANGFSAVLSLEDQGRFALGYYHQRQDFFRNSKPPADPGTAAGEQSEPTTIAEETAA